MPDTGKIDTYRSPGGFGVRLDVGNAYSGYAVTPTLILYWLKSVRMVSLLNRQSVKCNAA